MKSTKSDEDRGVYREVYCPHCKRKYMDKCWYDYKSKDGLKEYALTRCTTCNMTLYAEKGVLEGIGFNTNKDIISKFSGIMLR